MSSEPNVQRHYTVDNLGEVILAALRKAGKDPTQLTAADLATVDEFHIRGRAATLELAELAAPGADSRVLDVGSGIGGTARHLAATFGCHVTGIDLTPSFTETADMLSSRVGLDRLTAFQQADACAMPFESGSFDLAVTEHVQMNIGDKRAFYGEIARVLRPGGRFVFHDIFRGTGDLDYPVPWADHAGLSFLEDPEAVRQILFDVGLELESWRDCTPESTEFFNRLDRLSELPPVGIHVLMGPLAKEKIGNLAGNLRRGAVAVGLASAVRRAS